jgi:hypothetical protein
MSRQFLRCAVARVVVAVAADEARDFRGAFVIYAANPRRFAAAACHRFASEIDFNGSSSLSREHKILCSH